jgi:hypothetical protein
MSEERMLKRMLMGRLLCRRREGQPRGRWLDSVVMGSEDGEEEYRTERDGGEFLREPKRTKGCSAAADNICR